MAILHRHRHAMEEEPDMPRIGGRREEMDQDLTRTVVNKLITILTDTRDIPSRTQEIGNKVENKNETETITKMHTPHHLKLLTPPSSPSRQQKLKNHMIDGMSQE